MESLAKTYLQLRSEDKKILSGIEHGMQSYEWVPAFEIIGFSRLSARTVEYGLHKLSKLKLISRSTQHYVGYTIDFRAYDLIAIADLVDRDVIRSLGELIGVGKESVIYEALGNGPLVIKFHRVGRTSFRHVRRVREHLKNRPRCHWIHAAKLAAKKEFRTLKKLYPEVSVPKPVALSRHALVMEHLSGKELYRVDLQNPDECLEIILEEIQSAWRLGLVHADLSEYNIIIDDNGEVRIIDWPQATSRKSQQAIALLKRDVDNILSFFKRSYGVNPDPLDVLSFIIEGEPEDQPEVMPS